MHYGNHVYATIVLCYKNPINFTKEDLSLAEMLGNTAAQAITTRWVVESQEKIIELAEKHKAMEVLLSQEKLKTEFIANTTHEFRTPLAIMRGQMELALRKKGSDKEELRAAKKAIKEATKEIAHLSDMLSDLVLITSVKSNQSPKENEKINLDSLFNDIAGRLETLAHKKRVSISMSIPNNAYIVGDEKYLTRLFLNLMGNAISYSKENSKVSIEAAEDKKNTIIKIIDNGIGISKADLPNIFERFYRGDKSHSSEDGQHSGLGLAIAKHIVEMHNGKIEVESTEGKGSTFMVYIPKKASNKKRRN